MSLLLLFRSAVTAPPTISGTVTVGEALTVSNGGWSFTPTSYSYKWQSSLTVGGTYTDVAGATSQSYVLTGVDLNRYVRAVVTAVDSTGSGSYGAGAYGTATYSGSGTGSGVSSSQTSAPVGPVAAAPVTPPVTITPQDPTVPAVLCWVAFASPPSSTSPVWVDLSGRVREFSVRRGRQQELDRQEAGTLTVRFANRDRALDPSNTASPWWPNVLPIRRIRLAAVWNNVTYELFNGFVERWPPARRGPYDAEVTVEATDNLAVLGNAKLNDFGLNAALTGQRINEVLDAVGWPPNRRTVDPGNSVVGDVDFTGDIALEHVQQVADSELGYVFSNAAGDVVFHDRHRRLRAPYTTSQGTFGDGGRGSGELPYVNISPSYDADHVYNDIAVSVPGDPDPATAADAVSQGQYWPRSLERSTLLLDWSEAQSAAEFLLSNYQDPYRRIDSIDLRPRMEPLLWPHVLGREIGDRITVKDRPPGGGAVNTQGCHIEGLEVGALGLEWTCSWQLSAADQSSYWVIGDPILGRIDSSNRIGY
jgi:hypothetical protein